MAKKWNLVQQRDSLDKTPAGCLPAATLYAGDEKVEELVAPEHKAMATKGIPLAGKITLDQYDRLVRLGYDGDVVRWWTQYHAAQELQKRSPGGGGVRTAVTVRPAQTIRRPQTVRQPEAVRPPVTFRPSHTLRQRQTQIVVGVGSLSVCPVCSVPVRADRLARHLSRVHPGGR